MVISTGVSGSKGIGLFRFVCEWNRFHIALYRCPFVCAVWIHYSESASTPVSELRFGWIGWPDSKGIMSRKDHVANWRYVHYKKYK